ncbi:MAG: hypothetical protein LBK61_05720, partial [Spirochaetaceae bacterium]|nr:hypothetical protein [Spirochaetaceae bacterium]
KLSSENPVKEGFARTAVRFHLNLPQGGFWGRRHWALLPAFCRLRGVAGRPPPPGTASGVWRGALRGLPPQRG